MQPLGNMRRLLVFVVAGLVGTVAGAAQARPHARSRVHAVKHESRHKRHRAGRRIRTVAPQAWEKDALVLSPARWPSR